MHDKEELTIEIERYLKYVRTSLNNLTLPTARENSYFKNNCIDSFHSFVDRIEMYGDEPRG